MKKIIEEICNYSVRKFGSDKNTLGVMLFGSVARNKPDKYSDIDIFVLEKNKGSFSRVNFVKNGIRTDVIFNSIKEVKEYLKNDKGNVRRITSHMLAHGQILFQRGNELNKLKSVAIKNLGLKTHRNTDEILMHKYSINDFWGEVQRDFEKGDWIAFGLDSQLLLNNLLDLFLKINGAFHKQPNETKEILRILDRRFADKIEKFYKTANFKTKINILSNLVEYIYKKSGGGLPRNWSIKNR